MTHLEILMLIDVCEHCVHLSESLNSKSSPVWYIQWMIVYVEQVVVG